MRRGPFAVHRHRHAALAAGEPHRDRTPADGPLPSLHLRLSMPTHDASTLLALGARLRTLREHGVLAVGSGSMTHAMPFLTREMSLDNVVPGWSADFDAWAGNALARGDVDTLAAFASKAPGMPYSHPTVEHVTPLFVTLGAATDPEAGVTMAIEGYSFGLSKRSFQAA